MYNKLYNGHIVQQKQNNVNVTLSYTVYICRKMKAGNAALNKQVETVMQEKESLHDKLR